MNTCGQREATSHAPHQVIASKMFVAPAKNSKRCGAAASWRTEGPGGGGSSVAPAGSTAVDILDLLPRPYARRRPTLREASLRRVRGEGRGQARSEPPATRAHELWTQSPRREGGGGGGEGPGGVGCRLLRARLARRRPAV